MAMLISICLLLILGLLFLVASEIRSSLSISLFYGLFLCTCQHGSGDMKIQVNPNGWSCLPTAFAMAVNKPVTWFIAQIGHPGAEEPYNVSGLKAGFHEQECIGVVQGMGFACTPIELVPTISPYTDGRSSRPIYFGLGIDDNWHRLLTHMKKAPGVLTGVYVPKQSGHAVAWDRDMIYDSNHSGQIYPLTEAYNHGFVPRCFWKIQRVRN